MKLVRHVKKLTKAKSKSLFKDRNKFCYFTFFRVAISFSNKRGCFRTLAR